MRSLSYYPVSFWFDFSRVSIVKTRNSVIEPNEGIQRNNSNSVFLLLFVFTVRCSRTSEDPYFMNMQCIVGVVWKFTAKVWRFIGRHKVLEVFRTQVLRTKMFHLWLKVFSDCTKQWQCKWTACHTVWEGANKILVVVSIRLWYQIEASQTVQCMNDESRVYKRKWHFISSCHPSALQLHKKSQKRICYLDLFCLV